MRLRRGSLPSAVPVAPAPVAREAPAPPPAVSPAPAASTAPARKLLEIKSGAVGTFYAQREPGAAPFVTVGTRVTPDKVVCQIEAMKIFNEVLAECTGVIAEILVENKQPVEFGTVLFRVDTSA